MQSSMKVLGIESSCDETAVALVDTDAPPSARILSHTLYSQVDIHAKTGGVVPEVAARAHVERLAELSASCFAQASADPDDVDLVAAVAGPGLIGGVSVGLMFGKGFALGRNIPIVPVNHLAGHALTCRLTNDTAYPYLLLLVSGGHCQILAVEGPSSFKRWATTIDDAVGEAFDKAAKAMGLGFPGGPALEREAQSGDPKRFDLPRPMIKKSTMDFSFSGLKTATMRAMQTCKTAQDRQDLAASFQAAVTDSLMGQTRKAAKLFAQRYGAGQTLVVAGGVACNQQIRGELQTLAGDMSMALVAPPLPLCTDNAAIIAWAGAEQFTENHASAEHGLAFAPRPRWPLDPSAEPSIFAGAKKA